MFTAGVERERETLRTKRITIGIFALLGCYES